MREVELCERRHKFPVAFLFGTGTAHVENNVLVWVYLEKVAALVGEVARVAALLARWAYGVRRLVGNFASDSSPTMGGAVGKLFSNAPPGSEQGTPCLFCNIASAKDPNTTLLYQDEEYVVFRDIHPASTHHYLVVPKMHIRSVKGLTPADIPLVRRLIDIGQQVLLEKGGTLDSLRMGFHWPPFTSINHLHLHIISPMEQMSTLSKVIYMPGSAWFCPVDDAIAYIERTGTSPEA